MSSSYSSLSHILCKHHHVLLGILEDLQQLCLQLVVLCNAHVQASLCQISFGSTVSWTKACSGWPFNLYNPPSCSPITIASLIVFPLGNMRTWPYTNKTII